jgi:hypothetical protein
VEPITLGLAAAGLFAAKMIERLGERTGDRVADSVEPIKSGIVHALDTGKHGDLEPLKRVEQAPDSRIAVEALGSAIATAVGNNPELARPLEILIANSGWTAESANNSFEVNLHDKAQVDRIYQANRDVNIRET